MSALRANVQFAAPVNDSEPPYCDICHCRHTPRDHVSLDEMKQNYIKKVYDDLGHRKLETARVLGIRLNTLKSALSRFD